MTPRDGLDSPSGSVVDSSAGSSSHSGLPRWLRLAPGRIVLWRSASCVQVGLNPSTAMVLDELSPPLAHLLRSMDGIRTTPDLLAEAEAAGAAPGAAAELLADLYRAGLLQDAGVVTGRVSAAARTTPAAWSWYRAAVAAETTGWSAHTSRPARDVLHRRQSASVRVIGSGRVGVAVATALAAAGVGHVEVTATGTVQPTDLGTGYRSEDMGRSRAAAAADAIRRSAPLAPPSGHYPPNLVVLSDTVVPDPAVVTELIAARTTHLIACAVDGRAVVGPLVAPGRSSCLRCAELYRTEADRLWPRLAAQLVNQIPVAGVAVGMLAAALATEQVLAALTGPGAGLPVPPTWGAALELDPVTLRLSQHPRPVHPLCGCGAACPEPHAGQSYQPQQSHYTLEQARGDNQGRDRDSAQSVPANRPAGEPAPRSGRAGRRGVG